MSFEEVSLVVMEMRVGRCECTRRGAGGEFRCSWCYLVRCFPLGIRSFVNCSHLSHSLGVLSANAAKGNSFSLLCTPPESKLQSSSKKPAFPQVPRSNRIKNWDWHLAKTEMKLLPESKESIKGDEQCMYLRVFLLTHCSRKSGLRPLLPDGYRLPWCLSKLCLPRCSAAPGPLKQASFRMAVVNRAQKAGKKCAQCQQSLCLSDGISVASFSSLIFFLIFLL